MISLPWLWPTGCRVVWWEFDDVSGYLLQVRYPITQWWLSGGLLVFSRLIARMQYISRAGKIWMRIWGDHFTPRLSDKTIPPRCFPLAAPMQSKHIRTYVRGLSLCLMLQKRRELGTAAGKMSPEPPPPTPRITLTHARTLHSQADGFYIEHWIT